MCRTAKSVEDDLLKKILLSTRRVLEIEKDLKQFNNHIFSKALIKTFHEELLHCFINVSAVVGNAMRDLRKEFIFWVKGKKLPLHPLLHLHHLGG